MADVFNRDKRSMVMSLIRSGGNKDTELALIQILRSQKIIGWRRRWKVVGKPDFVFPKAKVAIFVDGCFWHGCHKHSRLPQSNQSYWLKKRRRNAARDRSVSTTLRRQGWQVLRLWEHDLALKRRKWLLRRLRKAIGYKPKSETTIRTKQSSWRLTAAAGRARISSIKNL